MAKRRTAQMDAVSDGGLNEGSVWMVTGNVLPLTWGGMKIDRSVFKMKAKSAEVFSVCLYVLSIFSRGRI